MTFVFSIGGSEWKSTYRVEYKKSKMFYSVLHDCEDVYVQEINLKPLKWKEFQAFIETECNWEKKYINCENPNGKSWKFQFKNDRKSLFVTGQNAFPPNFNDFFDRLIDLLGPDRGLF